MDFLAFPCGSDWETYWDNAAIFWHPGWEGLVYQDWRKPLHALLLGGLGELVGYLGAARALSLASALALVLGAGLAGRALGNRWTGALAAVAMACLAPLEQASRWVNNYPLIAGTSAAAFGLGAACLRWPRLGWALAAGAAGGLAWAADSRGLTAMLAALLMGLGGVVCLRPQPRRALAVLAALLVGVGATVGLDRGLQHHAGIELRSFEQRIAVQSVVSVGPGSPAEVQAACQPREGETADESSVSLDADCARAMLPHNMHVLRGQGVLPPVWLLALSLLALIPPTWGRRGSWGVLVTMGGSMATLGLGMAMMEYPDRYALPFLLPLLVCIPLAAERSAGLLAGRVDAPRALPIGAAVLAGLALTLAWPGAPGLVREHSTICLDADESSAAREESALAVANWALAEMRPEDLLLDCSPAPMPQLLLPQRLPLRHTPDIEGVCGSWVHDPPSAEGRRWLLVFLSSGSQGGGALSPNALRAAGWSVQTVPGMRGDRLGRLVLWEWRGGV